MRDPARIDKILAAVRAAWIKQPDTRLGQLLDNLTYQPGGGKIDVFYIEDDNLLERLTRK